MKAGVISPTYVSTAAQLADIFTKVVSVSQHHHLLSKMGVLNLFSPPNLRGIVEEITAALANTQLEVVRFQLQIVVTVLYIF